MSSRMLRPSELDLRIQVASGISVSRDGARTEGAHIKGKLANTDGTALVRYALQWVENGQ